MIAPSTASRQPLYVVQTCRILPLQAPPPPSQGPSQKAASEAIKNGPLIEALVAGLERGSPALVTEVAWILTYLAAGPEAHSDRLIKLGALPPLVRHLVTATEKHVVIPVLRAVGNVVSGQDSKTDAAFGAAPGGPGEGIGEVGGTCILYFTVDGFSVRRFRCLDVHDAVREKGESGYCRFSFSYRWNSE